MTKVELAALEKVFAAEIEGRLHQSKAKIFKRLAELGMVAEETIVLRGRFPVRVTGWALTHLGRLIYCTSCK